MKLTSEPTDTAVKVSFYPSIGAGSARLITYTFLLDFSRKTRQGNTRTEPEGEEDDDG
jgi:hypothetical protein